MVKALWLYQLGVMMYRVPCLELPKQGGKKKMASSSPVDCSFLVYDKGSKGSRFKDAML